MEPFDAPFGLSLSKTERFAQGRLRAFLGTGAVARHFPRIPLRCLRATCHGFQDPGALFLEQSCLRKCHSSPVLDQKPVARQYACQELFKYQQPEVKLHTVRECPAFNYLPGSERLRGEIKKAFGRQMGAVETWPTGSAGFGCIK